MTPESIIPDTTGLHLQHTHIHTHYESLLKPEIWPMTVQNSPKELTEPLADQRAPPSVTDPQWLLMKKCLVTDTLAVIRME